MHLPRRSQTGADLAHFLGRGGVQENARVGAKKLREKKFFAAFGRQPQNTNPLIHEFVCEQCVLLLKWRPQAPNLF